MYLASTTKPPSHCFLNMMVLKSCKITELNTKVFDFKDQKLVQQLPKYKHFMVLVCFCFVTRTFKGSELV